MKTKIFVYGLLVFLPSTNSLSATINSNIQTDNPIYSNANYAEAPLGDDKIRLHVMPSFNVARNAWLDWAGREVPNPYKIRLHVEPSWDDALIDWAGNEVPREFRICPAVMPFMTSDGRWINGCGDEVPNPRRQLIIQDLSYSNQAGRDNHATRNFTRRARAATGFSRQRNRSANG